MSFDEVFNKVANQENFEQYNDTLLWLVHNKPNQVKEIIYPFIHVVNDGNNLSVLYDAINNNSSFMPEQHFRVYVHNVVNVSRTNDKLLQVIKLVFSKCL
jgi:hypothetical protein